MPPSVLVGLRRIPPSEPTALLLRHSVRDEIPAGETGHDLPITEDGVRIAEELGEELGTRLRGLWTSPVPRCIQTAQYLSSASGGHPKIAIDPLLAAPGVFISDPALAWKTYASIGLWSMVNHLMEGREDLPGFAQPARAVRRLLSHLLVTAEDLNGLGVFVTHDLVIAIVTSLCFGEALPPSDWPVFLEGAFVWRKDDAFRVLYRDREVEVPYDYEAPVEETESQT